MKIEIDLNDIFQGDEDGPGETLEEACRRQIIDRLSGDLRKRLFDRLDHQLSEVMSQQISAVVAEKMPALIDDLMNATYTPVSTYGQRGEPTSFRDELIKSVIANMKYEPKEYNGRENAFTQAVKSIVEKQTAVMKAELTKNIDEQFKRDALSHAVNLLSERLGLNKKV